MSEDLKVLIVDDEELARLRLRGLVHDCPSPKAQVAGEAANASQALVWLADHRCDLVLLDIHMPGLDGTQLAARVKQLPQPPAIVFVTAHAEHALQAFDLDAVDYLTKPVRRERLQAALQRVAQRLGQGQAGARPAEPGDEPVIVVSELGRKVRVPVSEVLYLKAELKYVTLRTATHTHVLDDALTDLEQRLGDRFLRIHRNALVARKALRALERRVLAAEGEEDAAEGWVVRVAPVDEWLVVSRRQVSAVKEAIAEGGL
ncbi:LytTR family DNA-binding domain-containing protein [Rhizobacter sp. J219]|jgi:two-component system response regulator AlgR|uniref:LytR/AlgR family response regulator transcription factor n=1 Tax=Rhizobacter sp. J219 TaxID=2898430 RepID=UPI0021510AD5|nr:LytTR family DNA-binding domain-containing protein [Rhizobacter sp. J219]MCR5885950.1 LytTR family DNA-binding domain-containing protein [Rhizobacter sp. J219]